MKKIKHDERNTLLVVALPSGQVRKAIDQHHVKNMLMELETQVLVRMQAGVTIESDFFLKLIQDKQAQVSSMYDPTQEDL